MAGGDFVDTALMFTLGIGFHPQLGMIIHAPGSVILPQANSHQAVHRCPVLRWVSAQRRRWDLQPPTIVFGISNQQSDILNKVRE